MKWGSFCFVLSWLFSLSPSFGWHIKQFWMTFTALLSFLDWETHHLWGSTTDTSMCDFVCIVVVDCHQNYLNFSVYFYFVTSSLHYYHALPHIIIIIIDSQLQLIHHGLTFFKTIRNISREITTTSIRCEREKTSLWDTKANCKSLI